MLCPNSACQKELAPDAFFCSWCLEYAAAPGAGRKPNLFSRFVALQLDPLIAIAAYLLAAAISLVVFQGAGLLMFFLFPVAYIIWALTLFRRGLTPGKMLMGLQVVEQSTGRIPGFGTMFLREIVGRFISAIFFGLGYLWALWDKNGQAWHDKLAGTVVLKRHPAATFATFIAIKPDEENAMDAAPAISLPTGHDTSAQLALQTSAATSAVCPACGQPLGGECNFCTSCGAACAAPNVHAFATAAGGAISTDTALPAPSGAAPTQAAFPGLAERSGEAATGS